MKTCRVCLNKKTFDLFVKDLSTKDGCKNICKECIKSVRKKYKSHANGKVYIDKWLSGNTRLIEGYAKKKSFIALLKRRIMRLSIKSNYNIGDLRHCSRCKQYLPMDLKWFHKCKKSGYSNRCRICDKLDGARDHKTRVEHVGYNHLWDTFRLFNFMCYNCEESNLTLLTIDHHDTRLPLSNNNSVVLCRKCNSSKHIKNPKEFYSKQKLVTINKILRLNK